MPSNGEMKAMTDEKRLSKLDIDGVKARVCNLSPHEGGVRPHNVRACRLDFPPLKGTTP